MKKSNNAFYLTVYTLSTLVLVSLIIIVGFILIKGIGNITPTFLLEEPSKMGKEGGIFSIIIGTVYLTLTSIAIATPIGVLAAVYFNEYAKDTVSVRIIRFFTETLAGIPSIIFGLFGFSFFVIFLGMGWSILSGGLTLSIMILPTIIRTTEETLKTVPMSYREGSLSLGATKWKTIIKVVLPCATGGILTGLILGIGRAIGETAAVMLTAGSTMGIPDSIMDSARSMPVHLYILASEGLSMEKTFATAALLIIIVFIINFTANTIMNRSFSNGK